MSKNRENGWDNPASVFKAETKNGTLTKVTGRYVLQSAIFEYSAKIQKSGRYPIRGKVRAISSTGTTLKKRGNAKKEILKMHSKIKKDGYTIVPLEVFITKGFAKVEIGLAKGKKLHDKRDDIAKKDQKREMDRARKNSY